MGFFACEVCGEMWVHGVCAKCKHIAEKFKSLEKRLSEAESKAYWTEQVLNDLFLSIAEPMAGTDNTIPAPRNLLENLMAVANHKKDDREHAYFKTNNVILLRLICECADLLRTRGTPKFAKILGSLDHCLREYWKMKGWDENKLDAGTPIHGRISYGSPLEPQPQLLEIIEALAKTDPLAFIAVGAEGVGALHGKYEANLECVLCKGEIPEGHDANCPWWAAKRYLENR